MWFWAACVHSSTAGSHKANYPVPSDIVQSASHGPVSPVVNPAMKAGDLLIFTEATLHCTLPWSNPHHETRRLLYRYSPKYIHMDGGTFKVTQPAWVSELTPAQQCVLLPLPCRHSALEPCADAGPVWMNSSERCSSRHTPTRGPRFPTTDNVCSRSSAARPLTAVAN